ncbi:DLW-39 family protein [Paenarthrobacter sp. Z7-10]|nr:DLW-39 family protein [Paenarthrobacter sp. Z7-10]
MEEEFVKKLLVVAAAVTGVVFYRKWQESNVRKSTWSNATDRVE